MHTNIRLDISTLAKAIDAQILSNDPSDKDTSELRAIVTDSRALITEPRAIVFAALRTPQGDGHRYIADMYNRGIRVFLTDRDDETHADKYPGATFLLVNDVRKALWDSAKFLRTKFTGPVIGITGSIGKTFAKELLSSCNIWEHCARSPRSWNSNIGVPETMWLIAGADAAIVEAGISHSGEMNILADIIRPTIGVFTAITDEHSDGFASIEEKCREKARLFSTATDIYYDASYPLIASVLTQMYPNKHLHPCANIWEICRAIAAHFGKTISYSPAQIGRYARDCQSPYYNYK